MQFWLTPAMLRTNRMVGLAHAAEQAGFHGMTVPDHPAVPAVISTPYPYDPGVEVQLGAESEFADPLVAIAFLASTTTTLRFATHVIVAALRHPVLLAKAVGTTARLSGDRLELGIGAGWMEEEFLALGVDFSTRGRRTDETIQALRALLLGEVTSFSGDLIYFPALTVSPVPRRPVPLLVGGHSPAALRRAARWGDGWVGVDGTLDEISSTIHRLRSLRDEYAGPDVPFTVRVGLDRLPQESDVASLEDLGVSGVMVSPAQIRGAQATLLDDIAAYGDSVIRRCRR